MRHIFHQEFKADSRPFTHNRPIYHSVIAVDASTKIKHFRWLPSTFNPLLLDVWLALKLNSQTFKDISLIFEINSRTFWVFLSIQGRFKASLEYMVGVGLGTLKIDNSWWQEVLPAMVQRQNSSLCTERAGTVEHSCRSSPHVHLRFLNLTVTKVLTLPLESPKGKFSAII